MDNGAGLDHDLLKRVVVHNGILVVDEGDVGDADEAEDGAQVRSEEVHRLHRLALPVATAATRHQHHHLFALRQAFVVVVALNLEGAVDAHDLVNVSLEVRGHAEVVHRHAAHDEVGRQKLIDQRVRKLDRLLHLGRVLLQRREGGGYPQFIHGWHGVVPQVAVGDGAVRVRGFPGLDELLGKLARV